MNKTTTTLAIFSLGLVGFSKAEVLLSPGDQIIGGILSGDNFIEGLAGFAAGVNNWPGAEPPEELIDGSFGGGAAKYLNFAELNTGVIITPSKGATVANRMTLWTANDAIPRDPTSYELYGTNVAITKGGPGTNYAKSDFTLISEGPLSLPDERATVATPIGDAPYETGPLQTIDFDNSVSYTSYMLIFPTVKDALSANSMQVSELALENVVNTSAEIEITEIDYDKTNDTVTLTWTSQPGASYTVYYSQDLENWDFDVEDNVEAEEGSGTTTFGPFPNPSPGSLLGFFRVDLN